MKFHSVHGSSIVLSDNKTTATRSDGSFCDAIVFSDQQVKVNQKVCLEVTASANWSGALRVGFTSHDPNKINANDLPRYAIPSLAKREGYWIQPIPETLLYTTCKLTLYLSTQGHLQLFVNDEHKGACPLGVPKDKALWLCVDLYGNSRCAKWIKTGQY